MKTLSIILLLAVVFACQEEQIEPTATSTNSTVDNARTKPNRSCNPDYYVFLLSEKEWVEQTIRILTIIGRTDRLRYYEDYRHVVIWELNRCSI
ncbi:MAG TPA: hypothetical protein VK589_04310 [Chryseolinea sp.]|nr:hypothetical protein [Chryseolinea sp.]